jgi:hypothetical protein
MGIPVFLQRCYDAHFHAVLMLLCEYNTAGAGSRGTSNTTGMRQKRPSVVVRLMKGPTDTASPAQFCQGLPHTSPQEFSCNRSCFSLTRQALMAKISCSSTDWLHLQCFRADTCDVGGRASGACIRATGDPLAGLRPAAGAALPAHAGGNVASIVSQRQLARLQHTAVSHQESTAACCLGILLRLHCGTCTQRCWTLDAGRHSYLIGWRCIPHRHSVVQLADLCLAHRKIVHTCKSTEPVAP